MREDMDARIYLAGCAPHEVPVDYPHEAPVNTEPRTPFKSGTRALSIALQWRRGDFMMAQAISDELVACRISPDEAVALKDWAERVEEWRRNHQLECVRRKLRRRARWALDWADAILKQAEIDALARFNMADADKRADEHGAS